MRASGRPASRSPAILPPRPAHGSAGVDCRRRAAARRAGCSRCRAGGYRHRLPHSSARRPYRVGRPWWCPVLSQCGGHVQCRRVGDAAGRPRARRARGQEGACGRQGRGGAPSDRRGNCRARAWCQRTSQPWPYSRSLRRPRVFHGEDAYLLGDVVHHPLQLNDQGISFLSETEPKRALRAREELLTALQGRDVSIGMTRFPGLDFQQSPRRMDVSGPPPGSGSQRGARSVSGGYVSSTGGQGRHRA